MFDNKGIFIGHQDNDPQQVYRTTERANTTAPTSIDPDKVNSILQHPLEIEPAQYEWLSPTVVPIAEKMERLCSNKGEPSPTPNDAEHAPIQARDPVNHPSHYTYGTIETIDYIEDKGQNFNLGNAVKYVSRAGHKIDAIEDLKKAVWYINREIMRLQKEKSHA